MKLSNNKLAMIILLFIVFSVFGNLFVWLKVTGNLTLGKASLAYIGVCIDKPPTLESIPNQTVTANELFTYQVNAIDSSSLIYYYGIPTPVSPTINPLESFFISRTSGLMNFTPPNNEKGNYSIYIWVSHEICGNNSNASKIFILSVLIANKIPYWINYTRYLNLTEDILFTLNLSTFVTEPDNESISFAHNSTYQIFPSFDVSLAGLINFSANDSDVGIHKVNITVTDSRNGINSSIFIFSVINVNDAPILQAIPNMQTCEDSTFSYTVNASDEDLLIPPAYRTEVLYYYDNTTLFVIGENTGLIYFIPSYSQAGLHNARIYVSDEELSDFKDFSLHIIEVNDAPVLEYIGPQTMYVNSSFNYNASASDEEDGNSPGNLTFNLTFVNGTKFFDINPVTGNMNFTANDSVNGTYAIRICVADIGLSSPDVNISYCNETVSPKNDCENVSFTITRENHPPNITSYYPTTLNMTIYEGGSITFNASATDPEGTIPSLLWYKNHVIMIINDTYTFSPSTGDAGEYNITIVASDGELNTSVSWNITVIAVPITPPPPSFGGGGGGGGGGICTELWLCSDWSICQNASSPESQSILREMYNRIMLNCSLKNTSIEKCGFQIRSCYDKNKCGSALSRPAELQTCAFTLVPSCYDGMLDCHHGQCEVLPDCGGPCKPCPTCSDGIQNQGEEWIDCGGPCKPCPLEYPRPAKCGDNRCEMSELFRCKKDCGLFWVTIITLIIMVVALIMIIRREQLIIETAERKRISKKNRRYLQNLITLTQKAVDEKNMMLARHYYNQARNFYNSLLSEEKKAFYSKIIRLFSDIAKLK